VSNGNVMERSHPTPVDDANAVSRWLLAACAVSACVFFLLLFGACRGDVFDDSRAASRPLSSAPIAAAADDNAQGVTKMGFRTPPAVLSNERRASAFAAGDAPSRGERTRRSAEVQKMPVSAPPTIR
jgi:hypothetical protein